MVAVGELGVSGVTGDTEDDDEDDSGDRREALGASEGEGVRSPDDRFEVVVMKGRAGTAALILGSRRKEG